MRDNTAALRTVPERIWLAVVIRLLTREKTVAGSSPPVALQSALCNFFSYCSNGIRIPHKINVSLMTQLLNKLITIITIPNLLFEELQPTCKRCMITVTLCLKSCDKQYENRVSWSMVICSPEDYQPTDKHMSSNLKVILR